MNKVIILGRLTANPEIRYTQAGKAVASLTIAIFNNYQIIYLAISGNCFIYTTGHNERTNRQWHRGANTLPTPFNL